jgi:hypothetical protein
MKHWISARATKVRCLWVCSIEHSTSCPQYIQVKQILVESHPPFLTTCIYVYTTVGIFFIQFANVSDFVVDRKISSIEIHDHHPPPFFLAHLAIRPCELLSSLFVCPSTFHILIFSSETTGPIATKLWWNGPWMAPFQNCVW